MPNSTNALATWRILKGSAFGRWLFARVICLQAPYFATIRPRIDRLEPGDEPRDVAVPVEVAVLHSRS